MVVVVVVVVRAVKNKKWWPLKIVGATKFYAESRNEIRTASFVGFIIDTFF